MQYAATTPWSVFSKNQAIAFHTQKCVPKFAALATFAEFLWSPGLLSRANVRVPSAPCQTLYLSNESHAFSYASHRVHHRGAPARPQKLSAKRNAER